MAASGRRTGQTLRERYGPAYFHELGRKGNAARLAKGGPQRNAAAGRKGGETARERHGSEHYRRIGHLGGQQKAANRIDSARPASAMASSFGGSTTETPS